MLQQAYGEDGLSRTQCHEWYVPAFQIGAERPSKTTPNLDGLPRQWTTITLERACCDSSKSSPNCP